MILHGAARGRARWRWCVAAAGLAVVVAGPAGCTGSDDPGPAAAPPTTVSSPAPPTGGCLHEALFEVVVDEVAPEEFLGRVDAEDVEIAEAIVYPEGHPRAGEYVPQSQWGPEQRQAWGVFVTRRGQLDDLLLVLYERLTVELTPEEFFDRLTEAERRLLDHLVYPEGHPQAGEFVPAQELGAALAWEQYLHHRPPGPGCPW